MRTQEQKLRAAARSRELYHNNKESRERKKLKMKEWAFKNKDKILESSKKRESTPERREQRRKAQTKYRHKMQSLGLWKSNRGNRTQQTRNWISKEGNKEKKSAHMKVYEAIKKGLIIKKPCEVCSKTPAHAHHDDYTKPLVVRFLCAKHHYEHHKSQENA